MRPFDPDDDITESLRALRHAEARRAAPPRVERAVLAAWDAAHGTPAEGRFRVPVWRGAAAIAAGTLLAVSMTLLGNRLRTGLPNDNARPDATLLLVGEPILRGESARIVRVRMPASALPSLGIRGVTGDLAETVDVEVLIGEDGVARAIEVGM